MKNHQHYTKIFLYLFIWSYAAEAMSPYKVIPVLETLKEDLLDTMEEGSSDWVKDSHEADVLDEFAGNSINFDSTHRIRKRQTFFEKPLSFFSKLATVGTESLNLCAAAPGSKIFCVLNSLISKADSIKHLMWVLPSITGIMCLLSNSILSSLPKKLFDNKDDIFGIKEMLKLFKVKQSDYADFAKSTANGLVVSLIKNLKALDFDELKPLIDNLELKDKKKSKSKSSSDMGSLFPNFQWDSMGKGKWINSQCKNMEATSPATLLATAMKKRPCLSDVSLPGYFVFNKIPIAAWTNSILPVLRAWNSPLLLLTGSKCCIIPFAEKNKRNKCVHKYGLLDKPHGLPPKNGPPSVCGAINFIPGSTVNFTMNPEPNSTFVDSNQPNSTLINFPEPCDYPVSGSLNYDVADPCADAEKNIEMPAEDYSSSENLEGDIVADNFQEDEDDEGRSADPMYYN